MRPILPAALAAIALLGLPALAAKEVTVVPSGGGARLVVGGKLITQFRTSNGSLTAQKRAETAAERLRTLLPQGLSAGDVTVKARPDGSWGVYVEGGLLMIATEEEGKLREQTAEATARLWATNLKQALGKDEGAAAKQSDAAPAAAKAPAQAKAVAAKKPAAKPAPAKPAPTKQSVGVGITDLAVPLGEVRTLAVKGSATGPVALRVEGTAVTAQVTPSGDLIEVKGISPGKATIRLARGSKETAFDVWVKKWAGTVAETPTAMVTGSVAPAALVRKVAAERALDGVRREPGATVKITGPAEGIKPLGRGESVTVRVPILIDGASYLERKTHATVRVDNLVLQPEPARLLLYSNDPESVREYGALYEGLVEDEGPARLMFHHQNRMGQPFTFEVHLLNPNRVPVDVQIIEGEAGPVIDTIQVGHRAAQRYMDAAAKDVGYILTIPPGKSRTIYQVKMPHLQTVSGLYGLRIIDGGPLVAQVVASPEPSVPEVSDDLVFAAKSELDTYPTPHKFEKYAYTVGQSWTFIPLGRKAIPAKAPNKRLFGNYGVMYNLTVDLQNPTEEEKTVSVRLLAEAGWTRGVFMIDGKIVEAPQIAPPADAVLWTIKLAPQEHRQVKIQGIPVGGSAYPVSLVVRS